MTALPSPDPSADATLHATLQRTPLHALHLELGARMVPFAGYEMPVQYEGGILSEHRHARNAAVLFDVSHMGQLRLMGDGAATALETLVPMDILGLAVGRQRYALFTREDGGILDDLMVARTGDGLILVVNAACTQADTQYLVERVGDRCRVQPLPDRGLLALQGPQASQAIARLAPSLGSLKFMDTADVPIAGVPCFVSRSGYTGEDGFEISMPADQAVTVAKALLMQPEVRPAGLGARDTLRLEAGLCLYGHDIDATTTPIEAGLAWALQKVRLPGGARAGGYPGADEIESQRAAGTLTRRVGLIGSDKVPVREGAALVAGEGRTAGRVTSGTVSPMLGMPIAMGYVAANLAQAGTALHAMVRGKPQPMQVCAMPFVPHRYRR